MLDLEYLDIGVGFLFTVFILDYLLGELLGVWHDEGCEIFI